MPRVLMATEGWGILQDRDGNAQVGMAATFTNMDLSPATHWSAETGGTSSTAAVASDTRGRLMRWIEAGEYIITVDGETFSVNAVSGIAATPAPDLSSVYRVLRDRGGQLNAAGANTLLLLPDGGAPVAIANGLAGRGGIYLDPAIFTVAGLTTKFRLDVVTVTNNVAPGVAMTAGLYPITASAGGSASLSVTLGTVITGSTVAMTPGANTRLSGNSGDFTPPAAGVYALCCVVATGGMAANSSTSFRVVLQQRWI